jgi:hypothetical protein
MPNGYVTEILLHVERRGGIRPFDTTSTSQLDRRAIE